MTYSETQIQETLVELNKIIQCGQDAKICRNEMITLQDVKLAAAIPEKKVPDLDTDGKEKLDKFKEPVMKTIPAVPAKIQKPQYLGKDMSDTLRNEQIEHWFAQYKQIKSSMKTI